MIRISTSRIGDAVKIDVQDDGPGLAADGGRPGGIGLANTRERLRQLYGNDASLTLENAEPRGATEAADPEILELDALYGVDRG